MRLVGVSRLCSFLCDVLIAIRAKTASGRKGAGCSRSRRTCSRSGRSARRAGPNAAGVLVILSKHTFHTRFLPSLFQRNYEQVRLVHLIVIPVLVPQIVWGGSGVAQVFHDLLAELRLLLVAEVKDMGEEDRQEESWEVESGEDQRGETTLTWMWSADKARTWANVSVDEVYKKQDYACAFSGTVCECARCEARRNR